MQRLVLSLAFCTLCVGCGGSGLDTAPVSGVVTFNSEPLANASVTFTPIVPEDEPDAPASNGTTNEKGEYSLTVTTTGDHGAVVGSHNVTIVLFEDNSESDQVDPTKETSSLPEIEEAYEVESGSNEANFDL